MSPSSPLTSLSSTLQVPSAPGQEWTFIDDHLLMQGVDQTLDLTAVSHEVKFSSPMSAAWLTRRWRELLYNPRAAAPAIAQLEESWDRLLEVSTSNVPWSPAELALLHEFIVARQSVRSFDAVLPRC